MKYTLFMLFICMNMMPLFAMKRSSDLPDPDAKKIAAEKAAGEKAGEAAAHFVLAFLQDDEQPNQEENIQPIEKTPKG